MTAHRYFIQAYAVLLTLAGLFVLSVGVTGRFLPHDEQFLGMTARQLCAQHGCRIVHFMAHDRVSFGGAVAAVGLLSLWLARSPLRRGEPWAWWALVLSGAVGFGSFFGYLGFGYLDLWHGVATMGLLACFLLGLARLPGGSRRLFRPSVRWPLGSAAGFGRACLLATAAGMVLGGLTIW